MGKFVHNSGCEREKHCVLGFQIEKVVLQIGKEDAVAWLEVYLQQEQGLIFDLTVSRPMKTRILDRSFLIFWSYTPG